VLGHAGSLAHGLVEVRRDNLQGLVPVEARIELQSGIRHIDAGFLKRFLKAAKVLRDAVPRQK
jgi:hypothetical protein